MLHAALFGSIASARLGSIFSTGTIREGPSLHFLYLVLSTVVLHCFFWPQFQKPLSPPPERQLERAAQFWKAI